jgi:hypothetical protein
MLEARASRQQLVARALASRVAQGGDAVVATKQRGKPIKIGARILRLDSMFRPVEEKR